MKRIRKQYLWPFMCIAVVFNVLIGDLVSARLAIPLLYMDTVGTIFIAVCGGIPYAVLTGACSNVLKALWGGRMAAAYFAIVSVAIAVAAGLMVRKKFTLDKAIATGFLLSVVSAAFSIPIRLFLSGSHTGIGTDMISSAMMALGTERFWATFFSVVASDLVDKLLSCFLVLLLIKLLPARFWQNRSI